MEVAVWGIGEKHSQEAAETEREAAEMEREVTEV